MWKRRDNEEKKDIEAKVWKKIDDIYHKDIIFI